jgi:hypothetical protein
VSLGGIATYVAIFGIVILWITPWAILSLTFSSFTDLGARDSLLVGLLLGPLSFVLLLLLVLNKNKPDLVNESVFKDGKFFGETTDPFA